MKATNLNDSSSKSDRNSKTGVSVRVSVGKYHEISAKNGNVDARRGVWVR